MVFSFKFYMFATSAFFIFFEFPSSFCLSIIMLLIQTVLCQSFSSVNLTAVNIHLHHQNRYQ